MKLNSETIEILKNYLTISSHIHLSHDFPLSTASDGSATFAYVMENDKDVGGDFPVDFPIFNAKTFLDILIMQGGEEAELNFDSNGRFVLIESPNGAVVKFAASNSIHAPKITSLPQVDFVNFNFHNFNMTQRDWIDVKKACSILDTDEIVFSKNPKNGKLIMSAVKIIDERNVESSTNSYFFEPGGDSDSKVEVDDNFAITFKINHIPLINDDYNFKLGVGQHEAGAKVALLRVTALNKFVQYLINSEDQSTF